MDPDLCSRPTDIDYPAERISAAIFNGAAIAFDEH